MSDTPSTGAVVEAPEATEVSSHVTAAIGEVARAPKSPSRRAAAPAPAAPGGEAGSDTAEAPKRPRRTRSKAPAQTAKAAALDDAKAGEGAVVVSLDASAVPDADQVATAPAKGRQAAKGAATAPNRVRAARAPDASDEGALDAAPEPDVAVVDADPPARKAPAPRAKRKSRVAAEALPAAPPPSVQVATELVAADEGSSEAQRSGEAPHAPVGSVEAAPGVEAASGVAGLPPSGEASDAQDVAIGALRSGRSAEERSAHVEEVSSEVEVASELEVEVAATAEPRTPDDAVEVLAVAGRGRRTPRRRDGRGERTPIDSVQATTTREDEVHDAPARTPRGHHGAAPAHDAIALESERRPLREDGELPHDRFDPDAVKVVARLHQYGHQAYFVGGCVRDLILDRPPKDFDVATSATPNEVRNIFRNCRLIGRRFRLAHVYFKGGKVVEVSTFRANPTELEAHAPVEEGVEAASDDLLITHDNVFGTAEEDARRRDFTMNGLFYDIESGTVLDFVNGRRDLERLQIRTIGDPEVRMREDPVRILRAVRFAAKLGLDIESRTYAAMEGAVEDLSRCAPARLLEETFRLLRGGYAQTSLQLLDALDALRVLLPPLGDAIRAGGKEAEARCWSFAGALDAQILAGAEFDDSVLLAALLVPISGGEPEEDEDGQRQSVGAEIEELLAALVQSARLPRRIAERSRQLLLAQRTLSGERRRRGGQAGFRRHPVFQDALQIFEMTVAATGQHAEALEAWKAGSTPVPGAPVRAVESEGAKRPRRRRGRRRGGAPSAGGDGSPPGGA